MPKNHQRDMQIINEVPALVYGVRLDDSIVFVNPYFTVATGFSEDELKVVNWRSKLRWSDRRQDDKSVVEFLTKEDAPSFYEAELTNKKGERRVIRWNHLFLRDEDGDLAEIIGFGTDMTNRQRADDLAREALADLDRIFDAMSDVVTIQDTEMRIVRVNRAACLALSASPEELIGKHCYEVFRGESTPCPSCPEVETISDHLPHESEIEHARLGRKFVVTASPFFDASGNFTGLIHIAKDVTEHKMLEAQLRQAQKMEAIGTLAGGIAHDFNNILGAVLGYTDLALMYSSDPQVRENLEEVKKAGSRAKDLVGQILTFSRQRETMRKPILIAPIIKEALKLLRASLPTTIDLKLDLVTENSKIMADPTQVHQVLMNLCTNAFHAMHGKTGTIEITLAEEDLESEMVTRYHTIGPGAYVKLSVRDTGCGIEQIIIDRIFEPFFTTKAVGDGTGMGLSVVHGIIKSYGGAITVGSEPGKGTTFHVFLPRIDAAQDEEGGYIAMMPSSGSERILFVDDEEALTKMGERMLRYLGYEVVVRTSSVEALEVVRANPDRFDLVITDYTMPNMTGLELAKELLALRPGFPIIICTGFSEEVTEEMVKNMGVRELVMKPLAIHDLAEVIRSVLDH